MSCGWWAKIWGCHRRSPFVSAIELVPWHTRISFQTNLTIIEAQSFVPKTGYFSIWPPALVDAVELPTETSVASIRAHRKLRLRAIEGRSPSNLQFLRQERKSRWPGRWTVEGQGFVVATVPAWYEIALSGPCPPGEIFLRFPPTTLKELRPLSTM